MKIAMSLIYYGLWWGGGGTIYINEIIRRLHNSGTEIDVICGRPLLRDYIVKNEFADIYKARMLWSGQFFWKVKNELSKILLVSFTHNACEASYIPNCHRLLMSREYELIHTHDLPDLAAALMVKKKKRTPVIAMSHHAHPLFPLFPWFSGFSKAFTRKLLQGADMVISTGDGVDRIKYDYNVEVKRVDPGVDSSLFRSDCNARSNIRAAYGIDDSDIVILFVGRLIPLKNIPLQFKILKETLGTIKNVRLLIVGDGILRGELEGQVKNIGLNDHVIFTGGVPHKEVYKWYSASDIFLLTSHYDCYPISALEAMSCELPVISTDVGGVKDIVQHEETGFLCDVDSEKNLKKRLLQLIMDEELRGKMGKAGRKKVVKQHTWEESVKKCKEIYDTLLNRF